MLQGNDLLLINAVIDATSDEREERGLPVLTVTRRLFALVAAGERNFDTLKSAALKSDLVELADYDGKGPEPSLTRMRSE